MTDIRFPKKKKELAKNPDTIKVEAHLTKEEWADYEKIMAAKQWSAKKLNENIIREYLIANKKKK